MADDAGEKTEDATPKRLSDARKDGQVAKSQDFTAALALAAAMAALWFLGGATISRGRVFMRGMLSMEASGDSPIWSGSAMGDFAKAMSTTIFTVLPFMIVGAIVTAAAVFGQVGPLITFKPLEPKATKLSPVNGMKRVFGKDGQIKTLMSLLKVLVVFGVGILVFVRRAEDLVALPRLAFHQGAYMIARIGMEMAIWLVSVLLVLGIIDLIFQQWKHKQDLKMTKSEVKDERHSMEGDPETKKRRMRMHHEILSNQVRGETPQADVVIANPTHFSVALKYEGEKMRAPMVTAKGADLLALQMRSIAKAAGVPVVERPPLARALYHGVPIGSEVSAEHYEAVAEVLAYVYRLDASARQRAQASAREAAA